MLEEWTNLENISFYPIKGVVNMSLYADIQPGLSSKSKEVTIFRELLKSLRKIGLVHEMHGPKTYQVEFRDPVFAPLTTRCELCDLFIVVLKDGKGKFTFLQCKRDFSANYLMNNITAIPIRQFYLLGYRPEIYPHTKSFIIPRTILSEALTPSIGTLGVFYLDSLGKVNMEYSVMELMHTNSSIGVVDFQKNVNKNYSFQGRYKHIRTINGYEEVERLEHLDDFEKHLLDLKIGEPITHSNQESSSFALNIAKKVLSESITPNDLLLLKISRLFEEIGGGISNNDDFQDFMDSTNILIIDGDEVKNTDI